MLVVRLAFGIAGSRSSAKASIGVSLLQLYGVIILRASYRGSDGLQCVIQTKHASKPPLDTQSM